MNIGLLFGMVVAVFFIGILMVFGYQQIGNVTDIQDTAAFKKTIENLETAVDRVYSLGGESSEKFSFSFPTSVQKVCFVPTYRMDSGERITALSTRTDQMKRELPDILTGSYREKHNLADLLAQMRVKGNVDQNQSMLVFHQGTSVPEWVFIDHLKPQNDVYYRNSDITCFSGNEQVWLKRHYDSSGAWVDIEEA